MVKPEFLRRAGWIALAVAVVLCFAGIFQHGLWTPDEPREAEIGREMLLSNYSAMPTLGGEPFLEKPPLYAWITAAFYAVFGVSEGAARLPAALLSIGAIWVAYLMGRRAAGRVAGLCSAIVLATMWQFSETSHKAVLDIGLTFFVAAGHLAFLRLKSARRAWSYTAIGLCSGLAFLTKAWIGPALLCAPPILAAAAMRDWSYVRRVLPRAFVAAVLGVALLGGPWVMALAATPGGGWAAVKESLVTEYVGRSVGGAEFTKQGHANPPWYYLTTALVIALPWCFALPAMLKGGTLARSWRGGRSLWCALTFVAGVVLLSVPSGKRDLYLVPMMPALAVPVGVWLSRVGSRRGGAWDRRTATALFWLPYSIGSLLGCAMAVVGVMQLAGIQMQLPFPAPGPLLSVWLVIGAIATIGGIEFARRRQHSAARVATVLTVLFACLSLFQRPAADLSRDMSAGCREIAGLVPRGERFIALDADETTLGVVPFYSGRILENVVGADAAEAADKALAILESGAARHLVVMDKDVRKLTPPLKKRLELVKTVRVSATRDVNVYVLKP